MHVKHDPISLPTPMRHLRVLMQVVESKISELPLDYFALVLDGWSSGMTHYLALSVSIQTNNTEGYYFCLINFSLFVDESLFGINKHTRYITYVLNLLRKTWMNVPGLIGDNCIVNKSAAKKHSLPLLGYASH